MNHPLTFCMLPPCILNYWTNLAEKIALENGESCEHLFKANEYNILKDDEEKKEYKNTHYQLDVIIKPNSDDSKTQIIIRCRPCNPCMGSIYNCTKTFPSTEESIRLMLLEINKEEDNG